MASRADRDQLANALAISFNIHETGVIVTDSVVTRLDIAQMKASVLVSKSFVLYVFRATPRTNVVELYFGFSDRNFANLLHDTPFDSTGLRYVCRIVCLRSSGPQKHEKDDY